MKIDQQTATLDVVDIKAEPHVGPYVRRPLWPLGSVTNTETPSPVAVRPPISCSPNFA